MFISSDVHVVNFLHVYGCDDSLHLVMPKSQLTGFNKLFLSGTSHCYYMNHGLMLTSWNVAIIDNVDFTLYAA